MICLKCGKKENIWLCNACRLNTDIEELCREVINYNPETSKNVLWDEVCEEIGGVSFFRNLVFDLSDDLPTPRKEYLRFLSLLGNYSNVPKESRTWLYNIYDSIKDDKRLDRAEIMILNGALLGAYYMDYDYYKAEEVAKKLYEAEDIPWQASYNLADYYTKTRRYDLADEVIDDALRRYLDDERISKLFQDLNDKNTKQWIKAKEGKREYFPAPRENREEIRQKYVDFLASIGVEVYLPKSTEKHKTEEEASSKLISEPIEIKDANFDSFVAFDFETTGLSYKYDSIIEIGAVKVVDGKVIETDEFTFQELVRPLDYKKVSAQITKITGITNEEAYAARPVWEVLPDFQKFVGDNVLLGFNNMSFDCKFLSRASRHSDLIFENKYFDVMHYASRFKEVLDFNSSKISLGKLSDKLKIENPRAHRALADAITTARVYLKLKEIDSDLENDNFMGTADEW